MASLKALGGTSDILPEEARVWQEVEEKARHLFHLYGFQEIRTPILEDSAVFRQSLGAQAEIVNKQMYQFTDRGDRQIALRPEGTASIVRAFIEKGLDTTAGLTRWYYLGPMFRAERPQAGRRRQFHQIGVEVFGSKAPYQDAEVIELLRALCGTLGLAGFQLRLNSLGCGADRAKMLGLIQRQFAPLRKKLCQDCQERLQRNPLRILDCKEPDCPARWNPIDLTQALCGDCRGHFQAVLEALQASGLKRDVDYRLDPSLVRGLDYYTRTAFEVIHPDLGAQNALGGGGRYDTLVESLGGNPTPAVGFAVGVERILMVLKGKQDSCVRSRRSPSVFVAAVGESSLVAGFRLLSQLRAAGISAVTDYQRRTLRRQMSEASKLGCRLALLIGETERSKGVLTLKEMESGKQQEIPAASFLEEIQRRLKA